MANEPEVIPADDSWLNAGVEAVKELAPAALPEKALPAEKKEDPPAPAPTPEAAKPEAQAEPPKPADTPAPDSPKEKAPEETDPTQKYIKELHADRTQLTKLVETLISENAKTQAALMARTSPEKALSPEELEAQQARDREAFMADPKGFLAAREKELKESTAKEVSEQTQKDMAARLGYKTVDDMETAFAARTGLAAMGSQKDSAGAVKYPLVKEQAFKDLMGHSENLKAVFADFPEGTKPADALRDPKFWSMAYMRTALDYMAKKGTPAPAAASATGEPVNLSPSPPNNIPAGKAGAAQTLADEWAAVESANVRVL